MNRGLLAVAVLAAVLLTAPEPARAAGVEVRLAPMGRSYAPPSLRGKQGWLVITNRDWQDYTFVENRKGRASLYRGAARYPGGVVIPSGSTVTLALEKDTWEIRGETDEKLKVKVREGRTSTVTLEPFGYRGNTGLRGVSNDGDRVRDEILYDVYVQPPVVVQPAPPIIIERPAPPPVIIQRPPVIVERPHHRPRPPAHRPRPPQRPHKDDSWGFTFNFGKR